MNFFCFLLTVSILCVSHALTCTEPSASEDQFICEKILSSAIKGEDKDKIGSIANIPYYRLWLTSDRSAMCIDGKIKNLRGTGSGFHESDLPQNSSQIFPTQSQILIINDTDWILSLRGLVSKNQKILFPNYPENYDHINLNLKSLVLSVAKPTGIKGFANFELSCINKKISTISK